MEVNNTGRGITSHSHIFPLPEENNLGVFGGAPPPPPAAAAARMETNLYDLLSKLSLLGKKAEQLQEFFQSCHDRRSQQQEAANSEVYSLIRELIVTGAAILKHSSDLQQYENFPQDREDDDDDDDDDEIIEMNEEDILAEHCHYCEICGKGFRRDANVRMHMRAHGNQYKTLEALAGPHKDSLMAARPKRYSCPFKKCRRNKRHDKFKPLKSIASLRNHYKRSHCPKMYTCNKCGKEFSFVGDLKTHGKTCGHSKWQCSCGTTFSRKDKLFGHVALFEGGHNPLLPAEDLMNSNCSADQKRDGICNKDFRKLAEELLKDPGTISQGYANDEDLWLGVESNGFMQTDYKFQVGQENQFPLRNEEKKESSEYSLYESEFWPQFCAEIFNGYKQF